MAARPRGVAEAAASRQVAAFGATLSRRSTQGGDKNFTLLEVDLPEVRMLVTPQRYQVLTKQHLKPIEQTLEPRRICCHVPRWIVWRPRVDQFAEKAMFPAPVGLLEASKPVSRAEVEDSHRKAIHRRPSVPSKSPICRASASGASRDRTGDLLLAKQISLSTRVSWCRVSACKWGISVGHGRTRKDGARQTGAPSAFVTWGGGKRAAPLARLRQLEDAAAAKAALASAIAVCASSRGISSNSSITWPYVLRVSRASCPSWRAT